MPKVILMNEGHLKYGILKTL